MTSIVALSLVQAVLAGAAVVAAAFLAGGRRVLPAPGALAIWSLLAATALIGGALSLVGTGVVLQFGLVLREAGIAATVVLMVVGTGRVAGLEPPAWLVGLLVLIGVVRVSLLLATDLILSVPPAGGLASPGPLYTPTAALTFPLVAGWLAVVWREREEQIERKFLVLGAGGTMAVGMVAAFGRGLGREVAVALLTVPLLVVFVAVDRHRRWRQEELLERLRLQQEQLASALQVANGELQQALSVRDDLLDVVTHELRTPLTPIRGFLELLTTGDQRLDSPRTPMILQLMLRNAVRLNDLIDEALLARQLRRGRLDLPVGPTPIDLTTLVEAVLRRLQAGPLGPTLEVTVEIEAGLTLHVPEVDARQVLHQVLANALRHGAPPVALRAQKIGDMAQIEVVDHGNGIPPEFRDRLFELFSQASTGERREVAGLGLGMGLARRLCEGMRGSIREEQRDDLGACFVITLPATDPPSDDLTVQEAIVLPTSIAPGP